MPTLLLSYAEQQTYKPISANNAGKYTQLAYEVENNELRDLLGVALLQNIQGNPNSTNNYNLLNGTTMYDKFGNLISHKGLKFILAFLNFSRYLGESFAQDSFTGFVQKTRPDSTQLSEGSIKRLQQEARQIAMNEWELVKYYLNTNTSLFVLWQPIVSHSKFLPKFEGIRKTSLSNRPRLPHINVSGIIGHEAPVVTNEIYKNQTGIISVTIGPGYYINAIYFRYVSGGGLVKVGTTSGGDEFLPETNISSYTSLFTCKIETDQVAAPMLYIEITGLSDFTIEMKKFFI